MTHQKLLLIEIGLAELKEAIREVLREELGILGSTKNSAKEENLITRKEAAGLLGISLPTLSRLVMIGDLPASRLGGKIMFKKSEILGSLKRVQTQKFNRLLR